MWMRAKLTLNLKASITAAAGRLDGDDQKNAILAPLTNCHDTDRVVSREQNTHSGSFNNSEQFSIDVSQ